jgi:DNA-binding transcriptional regulator YbjK
MTQQSRRNDPARRQRIINATLAVIADHGTAATTHRRIAEAAEVPLGSVTYYFATLEDLLTAAFLKLAAESSAAFRARLEVATDRATACAAVIDIIANQVWAEPRTLLLSYELYAFAAKPLPLRRTS